MAIALKEGRPIRNAEAIAERPDGSRVPFIPYPTPLRDAKGNASTCLRSGIPSSGCAIRPRRMPQRKAGPPMHSVLAYSPKASCGGKRSFSVLLPSSNGLVEVP
jgi:hypothetical protein